MAWPLRKRRSDRVREFEELVSGFYRQSPITSANQALDRAVEEHNAWVAVNNSALESSRAEIDRRLESLRLLEVRIGEFDQQLARMSANAGSVDAYNQVLAERNALVGEQRQLAGEYNALNASHNQRVQSFNLEAKRKNADFESLRKVCTSEADGFRRWQEKKGPEKLARELMEFYASLCRELRSSGRHSPEVNDCVGRMRALRGELGAYARKQHEANEHGLLLTQTTLGQAEHCYMIVDIAASLTSVTEEMVDVLDLRDKVGDEVELCLPNAIRIKAPQLLIPKITVDGQTAEYVKAVVLKESTPGVDGCLGMSFLNRFDYKIIRSGERRLSLDPLSNDDAASSFDVFLCHKSADVQPAQEIYELLTQAGYRPFLSEHSLAQAGSTEYMKTIDAAVALARHLVLVCSSKENAESPWVESEWRNFESMRRQGKKSGNIVPFLCGEMQAADVPEALSRYQVVRKADPNWTTTLLSYLPRT